MNADAVTHSGHATTMAAAVVAPRCNAHAFSWQAMRHRLIAVLAEAAARWPSSERSRVRICVATGGGLGGSGPAVRIERAALPGLPAPVSIPSPALAARRPDTPPLELPPLLMAASGEEVSGGGGRGEPMRVALDQTATSMVDPSLLYKSSARHVYDAARLAAGCSPLGKPINRGREKNDEKDPFAQKPPFDVLMYNEAGEVTECSIANIALEDAPSAAAGAGEGGVSRWATPPIECGLLPGVMRAELISQGAIYERVLLVDEVVAAVRAGRKLVAFNSVRGVYTLDLVLEGEEDEEGAKSRAERAHASAAATASTPSMASWSAATRSKL